MTKSKKSEKEKSYDLLNNMVREDNGLLVHKKARQKDIHPEYIGMFKEEYKLEEFMPGIYSDSNSFPDELFALQQRYTRGIYSHETALMLWEMTDVILAEYIMTFPQGYNTPTIKKWKINPKYITKDRYTIGKTTVETSFGNEVKIYDRERTLCDLLQTRHYTDKTVLLEAIKRYVASEQKDLRKLMKYAKIFKVENKLRPYLEILL